MKLKKVDPSYGEKLLYPSKPTIVSAEYEGRVGAMFASWWTQLSFKPFYIGVAIGHERFTYKLVDGAGKFGLNFIGYEHVERAPYLGDVSERFFRNKLERGGFKVFKGEVLGVPLLLDAYLAIELELVQKVSLGDHDLFVGEVKGMYAAELYDDNYVWYPDKLKPLFYMGRVKKGDRLFRRYATWSEGIYRDIEFAGGELRESHWRRYRVRREVLNVLREASPITLEAALKTVKFILRRYGLDEDDAIYYVKEAVYSGGVEVEGLE